MKKIAKLFGLIIILATIAFVVGFNLVGDLTNEENINPKKVINTVNEDYTILVNKTNVLRSNYTPKNLVKLNIEFLSDTSNEARCMEKKAADSLEDLVATAKKENIILIGSSAYRSYKSQLRILKEETDKKGVDYADKYVAKPGQSEHQSGLAVDVTNRVRCFDKTSKEAQWLANNAYKFGFILRYPDGKEDITGYNYEPWHIRYVGKDIAKEIYMKNITLEEYLSYKS